MRMRLGVLAVGIAALAMGGCGDGGGSSEAGRRQFVTIGTAPTGGAFYVFGGALAEVLNDQRESLGWRTSAEPTGGSMENIRRLSAGELQFAVSNTAITYFAVRGQAEDGKTYNVRTVMTAFPNIGTFVTTRGSGVRLLADFKGRRIYMGPQGAGFEYFLHPILEAHGIAAADIEPVYAGQQNAVEYLGDGSVSAAFLGGAMPLPAATAAAASLDLVFLPYDPSARAQLIKTYPFFDAATVPANTYRGQAEPLEAMIVGAAHVITHADMDEEMVYQFTRTVYEQREKLAEKFAAARAIRPEVVVRDTGVEFHPGAIRYYREIGIWPGGAASKAEE